MEISAGRYLCTSHIQTDMLMKDKRPYKTPQARARALQTEVMICISGNDMGTGELPGFGFDGEKGENEEA